MKKTGFTLIELLAVIVVLAIIALIATPIVMNVIKDSKKGATERSAERYLDAVETAVATDKLKEGTVLDGIYTVIEDGSLVLGENTLTVEVSGDIPEKGSKVAIQNGQVVPTGTNLNYGDYTVTIDDKGSAKAEEKKPLCIAIEPTEQQTSNYSDTEMETKVVGVQATKSNPYELGAVYSCNLGDGARTFYVLKEEENTVKLILNENMGEMVTWCISGRENNCEADGAKAYLASQTSGWKLDQEQITLPLYNDVNPVRNSDWIKANIYVGENTSLPYAYWLLEKISYNSFEARVMRASGLPGAYDVNTSDKVGVRPVITISKDNLSL